MANEGSRKLGHKVGGNRGIARAKKERKRKEAEIRNQKTPENRTRVYREGPVGKRGK